jgi:exosortase
MQNVEAFKSVRVDSRSLLQQSGWLVLAVFAVLLWLPEGRDLWTAWQANENLSHGPLIPVLAGMHLWLERDRLRRWTAAVPAGIGFALISALLYVAAVWADIDFLKPLALIGIMVGGIGYLGGWETLRASSGAIGFLVFMIPWPTTLIDHLAFPLQLMSSAYAALLAGMLGIPIQRDGVNLAVQATPGMPPIYSIIVAQACSGLTSLLVLLALGYLIAYHTPVRWYWRVMLMGATIPLTLCANALRLTIILIAGAHHNPGLAKWLHDHETPALIFLCSLVLTALRQGILIWSQPRATAQGGTAVEGSAGAEMSMTVDPVNLLYMPGNSYRKSTNSSGNSRDDHSIIVIPTIDPQ